MNARITLILSSVLILTVTVFAAGAYDADAYREVLAKDVQDQERIVVDHSSADTPVKIVLIKTKKRTIERDKKFLDDDGWLQGLMLRVANHTDKTVTHVGIRLLFRRTGDQEPGLPAHWQLDYGFNPLWLKPEEPIPSPLISPIPPGGEIEIALSDIERADVESFLAEAGFPTSRKRLEIMITSIGFSDETLWLYRHMFRRDPTSLGKPYPGWRPLDDALEDIKKPEKEKGSAKGRTAFYSRWL
jgi:hypothetical protein